MLKAVIFDMDGVLVDSMPYHADAWVSVFKDVGINIRREDIYDIEGSNHTGIINLVFKKACRTPEPADFPRLAQKKQEIFSKMNKVKVFDGIYECINSLKNKCLFGVASGSDRAVVIELIERFFPDTFSAIVSGNDVKEGKPSPEPYLKAVELLKVKKNECIVIENAPLGVESAKRAGLYCIAIPTYVKPELLKGADMVLADHEMLKDYLAGKSFLTTTMTIRNSNIPLSRRCDICSEEHSEKTTSCKECNNIIEKHKNKCTTSEVRTALKRAYSRTENGRRFFKCEYTGIESHFNITGKCIDPIDDAFILTFDHKNPIIKSNRGEVIVCLFLINQIKGKIPFDCFKNIIIVLSMYFINKNEENSDKIRETLVNIKNFYDEERVKSQRH